MESTKEDREKERGRRERGKERDSERERGGGEREETKVKRTLARSLTASTSSYNIWIQHLNLSASFVAGNSYLSLSSLSLSPPFIPQQVDTSLLYLSFVSPSGTLNCHRVESSLKVAELHNQI